MSNFYIFLLPLLIFYNSPLVKSFLFKKSKIVMCSPNMSHNNLVNFSKRVSEIENENRLILPKKIISISPGGFKGFYQFGVCKFIKENYDLEDYVFSGASAGSWNSLALCYKGDISDIQKVLLHSDIQKVKTIKNLKDVVKINILKHFRSDEFDLHKLYVGTTAIENYQSKTIIYGGFDNLEDAVNCCIASSHIPLITGGIHNVYRNVLHYDGGFSKHPYLNDEDIVIHITPTIWKGGDSKNNAFRFSDYTTLFSRHNYSFGEMIEEGYNDSKQYKSCLDNIFNNKKNGD